MRAAKSVAPDSGNERLSAMKRAIPNTKCQFASGRSLIGDRTILEDDTGSVGIGTDVPVSKLNPD